jgi:CRISPR/Cas system CMR-associated protein Cmr3 (group 5 of RAMP superfamily)
MQDTQIKSSTIIYYKIYSITNPNTKSGGIEFMAINILTSINMRHKLLHVILTQKVLFPNKREFVSNTQTRL